MEQLELIVNLPRTKVYNTIFEIHKNDWYYINQLFAITNNSTLLCSDNIMLIQAKNLNEYISAT